MGDGGDNAMYLMTDCASAASCSLQQDPRIVSAVVRFRVLAQRTHKLGSPRKRGCTHALVVQHNGARQAGCCASFHTARGMLLMPAYPPGGMVEEMAAWLATITKGTKGRRKRKV